MIWKFFSLCHTLLDDSTTNATYQIVKFKNQVKISLLAANGNLQALS